MKNLVAPNHVDKNSSHYAAVKAEMEYRGGCTIRALWSEDLGFWFAIEGSHRCAAAEELGIEIQIHDIGNDDTDEWETDLDGNASRDWDWLVDYLATVGHVNDGPVFEGVEP